MHQYEQVCLMLGDSCNFQCKYCLQRDNLVADTSKVVDRKVYDFLMEQAHQLVHTKGQQLELQFWGGEPLIYIDTIRQVVDSLRAARNMFTYTIVSNGSLLTQDIVDFLNSNCIEFVLSHDGENTAITRGVDVLKDTTILGLFNKIDYRRINSVLSALNPSIPKTLKYLEQTYGIENFRVSFDHLLETNPIPSEIYDFDMQEVGIGLDETMDNLLASWTSNTQSWEGSFFNGALSRLGEVVNNPVSELNNYPRCANMLRTININTDGDVHLCHNSGTKIGNITMGRDELLTEFSKYNRPQRPECIDCHCNAFCGTGCLLIPDGEQRERACIFKRFYYGKLLNTLIKFNGGAS